MLAVRLTLVLTCACRVAGWPVPYVLNEHTLPNLEISLASPKDPFPAEAEAVRHQERVRDEAMGARIDRLRRQSRKVLLAARAQAAMIIGRAMHNNISEPAADSQQQRPQSTSFLEKRMEQLPLASIALHIDVEPFNEPNATWAVGIQSLGRQTLLAVRNSYAEDVSHMQALSDGLLQELQVQLRTELGILHNSAETKDENFSVKPSLAPAALAAKLGQGNVHIVANPDGPAGVASIVQAMQTRSSIVEQLAAWKVFEIDSQLMQAERRMIKDMLEATVGRAMNLRLPIARAKTTNALSRADGPAL